MTANFLDAWKIVSLFYLVQKCLSESQASELKFPLKQKISGIPIRSESGLNDGDGQTTEGDSSDEDDEEYHTASFVSEGRERKYQGHHAV